MMKIGALMAVYILMVASPAFGHGTQGWLEDSTAIRVIARYDDGEPMSYTKVAVDGPGTTQVFQSGYTDRNGLFAFVPDVSGDYTVTVGDELGHQLVLGTKVSEEGIVIPPTDAELSYQYSGMKSGGIAGGLGIISGLAGLLYGWRQRRLRVQGVNGYGMQNS